MIDWQAISAEHAQLVWRTAARILAIRGSREADVADCFQETFLSALQLSESQPVQNWAGLLQRIATTRALDLLRRRMREAGGEPTDPNDVPARTASPPLQLENDELMQRLQAAVARLPGGQAEIFCLRHLNDMSYEDIARELGISVAAVGTSLTRTRARLRELLTPYFREGYKPT